MPSHILPNSVLIRLHAEYCRSIANETRLAILYELADEERSVGQLAAALDLSMATVSQHLRRLRTAGAVNSRRDGHTVYYFASDPRLITACRLIREAVIERHAADTALMTHLESRSSSGGETGKTRRTARDAARYHDEKRRRP